MQTRSRRLAATALALAALLPGAPAQEAPTGGAPGWPFPFFAMDTGTRDAAHATPEAQADMLRDLGYAGVDHSGLDGLVEFCEVLGNRSLQLYAVYAGMSIDDAADIAVYEAAFSAIRDRGACLWLPLTSRAHPPSSPAGDALAVPLLRQLGERAAASGVRLALYPHTDFWVERVEDAVRVATKVDLPNVGATFNLCHFLRVAGDQDLYATLQAAVPRLFLTTVNGADPGGGDWQTLIQTLDRGRFDVYGALLALHEFGYVGPVGLQGYGIGGDVQDNLRRSMAAWTSFGARYAAEWQDLMADGLVAWRDPRGAWLSVGAVAMDAAEPTQLSWSAGQGVLLNGPSGRTSNLLGTAEHGDIEAHLEFIVPKGSNSGVYFQGRYEIQILDSFGVETPGSGDCGGVYERWDDGRQPQGYEGRAPSRNASRPPGEWQAFDVIFRAPRFAPDGSKLANARFVRVWHNGVLIHVDAEVTGPTRAAAFADERPLGPLLLQGDHGPVAYRALRLRPLRTNADAWLAELLPEATLQELRGYGAEGSRLAWGHLTDRLRAVPPDLRALLECRLIDLLRAKGTTVAARGELCRILRTWGSRRAVPVLAEFLSTPELAHLAADALGSLPAPEAGGALVAALPTLQGDGAVPVLAALGRRGDLTAVPSVAARLADPDARVQRAAALALGALASPAAAAALRATPLPVALQALRDDALLRCAEAELAAGRAREAAAAFRALYEAAPPGALRLGALTGLVRAAGEASLPEVLAALRADDTSLRQAAARASLAITGEAAAVALAGALPGLSEEAQIALIYAIAERGTAAAATTATAIGNACASPSAAVRQAACVALETLGDGSHIPALVRLAASAEKVDAEPALTALERISGQGVAAALVALLTHPEPATRALVCRVLAARGTAGAFAALRQAADDGDERVRREARRGLAQVSGPAELPLLLEMLLTRPDADGREAAAQAIQVVGERAGAAAGHLGELLLAALPQAGPAAQPELLRLLGRFGGTEALELLTAATHSPDQAARESALRALAQWPNAAPLNTLADVVAADPQPVCRTLAWRGYVRLLGLAGDIPLAERLRRCREALALAPQPDERRLILAILPTLPDPQALAIAAEFLADPALQADARPAFLRLARWLAGTAQPGVRATIEAAWRDPAAGDDAFRAELQQALAGAALLRGRVALWNLAGPYAAAGQDSFATPWPPEQPGGTASWRPVGALDGPLTPFIGAGDMNLGALLGGENCAAYLRAGVFSHDARDVLLELGSDDGVKLWLNGTLAHANDARRPTHLGDDKAKAHLEQGWNTVLVKVTQTAGEWGLALRLTTPAGEPLADLVSRPE